jgi:hypothetical protein
MKVFLVFENGFAVFKNKEHFQVIPLILGPAIGDEQQKPHGDHRLAQ